MKASLGRDTRAVVDLDVISHNLRVVRGMLADGPAAADGAPPRVAAVLKANGYGLGAVRAAGELLAGGVDMLAVACLPEAVELRRSHPEAAILVMGHTPTAQLPVLAELGITATVFDLPQAEALARAGAALGRKARAHLKVDTGMNRLGLKPDADSPALVARMAALPGLELEGVFTHLALCDRASDQAQFGKLTAFVEAAAGVGVRFRYRHICDSIGLMRYPEFRLDLVRAGAVLLGVEPMNTPLTGKVGIRFPLSFVTRVSRLRRLEEGEGVGYDYTWRAPPGGAAIATLPAGYADGYPRCLSNKGEVLIRGHRAPVVGLVCMDQLTVDVSAVPGVEEGDEVVLLGNPVGSTAAGGEDGIPILDIAKRAGTNRNEMLCVIGRRVPRYYRKGGRPAGMVDYLLGEESLDD